MGALRTQGTLDCGRGRAWGEGAAALLMVLPRVRAPGEDLAHT